MRFRVRGAFGALVLLVLTGVFPTAAAAHLYLVSSQPERGVHLDSVPQQIRLRFSEPVELAFTRVELLGPDGSSVRLSAPQVSADDPRVLVARTEGVMVPGQHSIVWRTTSADGHPVNGRVDFSIDEEAEGLAAAATNEPQAVSPAHHDPGIFPEGGFSAESPGYVVVRWLTFVGLLGVIGVVSFQTIVLTLVRRRRTPEGLALLGSATKRSAAFGLAFSLLLVVAVLARLYTQSLALHGPEAALDRTSIEAILSRTTWGLGWIIQAAAIAVTLLGFAIARAYYRREPSEAVSDPPDAAATASAEFPQTQQLRATYAGSSSAYGGTDVATKERAERHAQASLSVDSGTSFGWTLAVLGALMLAFTPALGGHAIATPDYRWLAVLSDGLHVLGAGGWLGSLLAVVGIGIPAAMRLGKERRGRAVAVLANAFSPTALFFAAIVTATGVLSASFHLGSLADLWQSDYGRTLLLKIGVLSLLFATGAYNWLRVRPALGNEEGAHRLRRSAGIELAIGVVVLLITAVLVATPPPVDMRPSTEQMTIPTTP